MAFEDELHMYPIIHICKGTFIRKKESYTFISLQEVPTELKFLKCWPKSVPRLCKKRKKIHRNLLIWIYVFFLNVVHISGLTLIVKAFLLEPDLMPSVGFEFLFVLFYSMTNVKRTQFCYSCKLIHLYNDHVSNLNTSNIWNDEVHKQNVRPRNQHKDMIFIKLTLSNHWLNIFEIRWTTNQWPKPKINFVLHWYFVGDGGGVKGCCRCFVYLFFNIYKIYIHLLVILVKHSLIQIISKSVLLKEQWYNYNYSINKKLLN